MANLLVKICGLTNREDAETAVAAGADLLGFVFVTGTPRMVAAADAGWIRDLVGAETVGVFRDAPLATLLEVRDRLALDRLQLHGDEPDEWLDTLGPRTIRRVRPTPGVDWERIRALGRRCLPLLDPGAGTGIAWSWRKVPPPPPGVRFGVAGGLRPDTVGHAVRALRPYLVDVSSGVERSVGRKDPEMVRRFIAAARAAAEAPADARSGARTGTIDPSAEGG